MTIPDLTELEQLLEKATPAPWCGALLFEENHTEANYDLTDALVNAAPSLITAARERDEAQRELAECRSARDEAIKLMSEYARQAGDAKGRLEMSETAGIVEGWRERTEKAEAQRDEALRRVEEVERDESQWKAIADEQANLTALAELRRNQAQSALEDLQGEVGRFKEALRRCKAQFEFYVEQHMAKSPPDGAKAEANEHFAAICRMALNPSPEA